MKNKNGKIPDENLKKINEIERQTAENERKIDEKEGKLANNDLLIDENENHKYNFERQIAELERRMNKLERLLNEYLSNSNREIKSEINHFQLEEITINDEIIKNEKENICLICLDNYSISEKISYLPCFHYFHSSCIKNWLKIKCRCPLCNNNIN